ncbi:MAG: nucleotidyltransferase domain-containing protein [Candidatus Coatesbacteria bacterium]|nr:nucleotidyltransferase domain-containing protein [Candidatus Coatesbacteria bacterium]
MLSDNHSKADHYGDAPNLEYLIKRNNDPDLKAMALMGSFARGDAGEFSDIDILRFFEKEDKDRNGAGSHDIDGRLVVVCDIAHAKVDGWFTDPQMATRIVAGLRDAKPLFDPEGYFAEIQRRAVGFMWDESLQKKADEYASREMVGWAEEAHKGLEGLKTGDAGRLINANAGLCWGLPAVMRVKRGILLSSDNTYFSEVMTALGENSEWSLLCRKALCIDSPLSLKDQARAWLRLYVSTARMIEDAIRPEDRPVIEAAVSKIERMLSTS